MSLALERVTPVTVHDPRVLQQERIFPVLKGGEQVLYKVYTTTNVGASSITFHAPPPSSNVYVDRRIHLRMPVRLTIPVMTGVANGIYPLGKDRIAIRSFPVQKAMETVQMTINNQSMSINIGDMLSALELYNTCNKLKAIDYSKCASYPCNQSQQFADLVGTNRSALTSIATVASGCVPKSQPWALGTANNVSGSTVTEVQIIDFVSTEPLFLSPLYWGDSIGDDAGFYGVKTMDFTFNFVGNAGNRMLAIDGLGLYATQQGAMNAEVNVVASFNNFSSPAFAFAESVPALLFQYITPQLVDRGNAMQQVLNYPYFNIERYPTEQDSLTVANGLSAEINSTNVQLNSIPMKIYIFARPSNSVMQRNPFRPDAFYRLSQSAGSALSLQWGNRSGLLASASKQQIYDLCVRAGCTLSYADWAGLPQSYLAGSAGAQLVAGSVYYGTGSVIALDPVDLGLDSIEAPGKLDQITLQISATWQNPASTEKTGDKVTMYVVAVSAGIFTLFNGQASSLIGVLNSNDILNSHAQSESKMLNYFDTKEIYGGGFLSDLKSNLKALRSKKVKAAEGGAVSGAARVSRQTLASRLQ